MLITVPNADYAKFDPIYPRAYLVAAFIKVAVFKLWYIASCSYNEHYGIGVGVDSCLWYTEC